MTLRLYHHPRSRSARVRWLLEELEAPYELTVLTREERQTDEHRRRHPLGRVPALEDDVGVLYESAALCLQLADLYPDAGLNFDLGTHERGLVYQWTLFAMVELERAAIGVLSNENERARQEAPAAHFRASAGAIEAALEGHEFLVGDRLTVADVVAGAVLFFAERAELLGDFPAIGTYLRRLEARPARERAMTVGVA